MIYSQRLEAIIQQLATPFDTLVDIGSDHGYACIMAIERHIAKQAIAIDNKKGPLLRLQKTIQQYQLEDKITPLLSDGILQLSQPYDTWIIAGMGGLLMCEILNQRLHWTQSVATIILQPQSKLKEVRTFCQQNQLMIENETLVFEDKQFYSILKINNQLPFSALAESELYFGRDNFLLKDVHWLTTRKQFLQKYASYDSDYQKEWQLLNQYFS